MTNKRDLKRTFKLVCSELFAECMAASMDDDGKNKENYDAMMSSILTVYNDFVSRISHPEPGMEQRAYYKSLKEDFQKQVSELIDQICNVG